MAQGDQAFSLDTASTVPSLTSDVENDGKSSLIQQQREASLSIDHPSAMNAKPFSSKNLMAYHHKQKHVHLSNGKAGPSSRSEQGHDLEMQSLQPRTTDENDNDVWTDPVRYITRHEIGFHVFGMQVTRSGVRCIRSVRMKFVQKNDSGQVVEEYEASGHWSMFGMLRNKKRYQDEILKGDQDRYLVVGRMSKNGHVLMEKLFRYAEHDEDQMFRRLHTTVRAVRGMRSLFSLKSVRGFGLYHCDPAAGHHTRAILNESQRSLLRSFYSSYKSRSQGGQEFLWNDWVFKHLNRNSNNPIDGKYSIEVLLNWSVLRLSIVTSIPVALSLAVGLWYQTLPVEDGSDPTGTAWIIATYIITAGALIIALLGVATGLEQS